MDFDPFGWLYSIAGDVSPEPWQRWAVVGLMIAALIFVLLVLYSGVMWLWHL